MTRYVKALLCGLALILAGASAQAAPKFTVGEKGLTVDAGPMGKPTLNIPIVRIAGKEERGVFTRISATEGRAEYPSGLLVKFAADGNQATVTFSRATPETKSFKFTMGFPTTWATGGRFAFDDEALAPLPAEKGKQIIASANGKTFTIVDPTGHGLTIQTPGGYHGLQDYRVFGTPTFSLQYHYDLYGKTEGTLKFTVRSADAEAAPAEAKPADAAQIRVDRYGQSAVTAFDGKVTSDEELRADGAAHLEELAAFQRDPRLDAFGGLAGSGEQYNLKKTGFFRLDRVNDRHVLVTPEGNLFFQIGMCGIARTDDDTTVKGREHIYEWLPEPTGKFASAWRGGNPKSGIMSFYVANWIRKFDKPWTIEAWTDQVTRRLLSWGFNSAGAFSVNTDAMKALNFPGVGTLPLQSGVPLLPGKIGAARVLDPFAPDAESALDAKFAGSVAQRANDPLLIGYFLGNEQHFEQLPKLLPTYKASQVAAKGRLVQFLKDKYKTIDAFNTAWNPAAPFAGFDDLGEATLFIRTDAANADMLEFFRLFLDHYYGLVERSFRKHDPNHLLLGSRWTPGTANNRDVVEIGGKYLDVISINYYAHAVEGAFLKKVSDWAGGKPMILSEWHYCSAERGLMAHREVKDDRERGQAYRNYIEQTAALPFVVGSQWFIYTDQALTGRFFQGFNGEGNNTGFVDVADRPYKHLVAAAKASHARIYDVMLGKESPFRYDNPAFNGGKDGRLAKVVAVPVALEGDKLDGTTTHWPQVPAEPIESSRIVVGRENPALRGDFRMTWDKQHLYFSIQVKDPTPLLNTKTGGGMWNSDAVELFIGPRDLDTEGAMIYSDRQILIGIGQEPQIHVIDHPDDGRACRAVVIKDVSGDGYILQAAIPWSVLNVEPRPGMELLFDVAIDNTDDGAQRQHQLMWNGVASNGSHRDAWGRAKLNIN